MHEIRVFRTHVEITNYRLGDYTYIERQHSIYDKVYHRFYPKGMHYDADQKILMLPKGVEIDKIKYALGDEAIVRFIPEPDPHDMIDRPLNIKYTPRDEDQKQAIKFIMGMDPYQYTANYAMLSLNLNTGKGKTYCTIASVALRNQRCAIITDTNGCLEQWYNFFQEYTDIDPSEICWVGPNNVRKLINSPKRYSVYLALHSTLRAYANRVGWIGVGNLIKSWGIGIKIYDEAHLDMDNMFKIDCYTNTNLSLYLTATPNRSSYEEDKIFQEHFKGVPMIDLFHYETDPHAKYASLRFNSRPTAAQISACKNAYGLNRMKYVDYLVEQPAFHQLLHILVKQATSKPGKSLWYVGTNNGIAVVFNWLMENYPELALSVGVFNGEIPKEERRSQLDKKIILTNTKSSGAAIDIPGLVEVVNLAEPFKSRVLAQQTFGRLRAPNTIYKDVVDLGFVQTRSYYNFKKPVFAKYATDCLEVRISDQELIDRAKKVLLERKDLYMPFDVPDPRPGHEGEYIKKEKYTDEEIDEKLNS